MPSVSQAQNAAMHAAAEGKSTLGIPQSVGKEFVAATGSVKDLPERIGKVRPHSPALKARGKGGTESRWMKMKK